MPQGNGSGKHAGSDRDLTAALNPLWEQIRQIKGDLVDLKLIKEKENPQPNKIMQENGDLKQENENLKVLINPKRFFLKFDRNCRFKRFVEKFFAPSCLFTIL